jgi:hypothetical protein
MQIDLNARRAAQQATDSEPSTVQVGDRTYTLVRDLKLNIFQHLSDRDIAAVAKALLANPEADWKEFSENVGMDEVSYLINQYGTSRGESDGSSEPSAPTGEPSTQISGVSMDGISVAPATAPKP